MNLHRKIDPKSIHNGMNTKHSFFQFDGRVQVEYKYVNYGADQTIVFINGCGTTFNFEWKHQQEFGEGKYNLLFHNSPGMGKSHRIENGTYLQQSASVMSKLCQHLDIKNAFVVAHSMGGLILPKLIELESIDVLGLVLICALDGSPLSNPPWNQLDIDYRRIVQSFGHGKLYYAAKAFENSTAETAFYILSKLICAGLDKQSFQILYKNVIQNPQTICQALLDMFEHGDTIGLLIEKIEKPALVIGCKKDFFVPPEVAHRLSRKISRAHLEIFENSSHAPMISEAQKLNSLLNRFFSSLEQPQTSCRQVNAQDQPNNQLNH